MVWVFGSHSVPCEIVLRMPCLCLDVSYKKTISSLPKWTQCSSLAERPYPGELRAQDGQLLCGWILGAGEVGRHQDIRLEERTFPIEEAEETSLCLVEAGGKAARAERLLPLVAQVVIISVHPHCFRKVQVQPLWALAQLQAFPFQICSVSGLCPLDRKI